MCHFAPRLREGIGMARIERKEARAQLLADLIGGRADGRPQPGAQIRRARVEGGHGLADEFTGRVRASRRARPPPGARAASHSSTGRQSATITVATRPGVVVMAASPRRPQASGSSRSSRMSLWTCSSQQGSPRGRGARASAARLAATARGSSPTWVPRLRLGPGRLADATAAGGKGRAYAGRRRPIDLRGSAAWRSRVGVAVGVEVVL